VNSGYVAPIKRQFQADKCDQSGQTTVEGDYQWVVNFGQPRRCVLHRGTSEERSAQLVTGTVAWRREEEVNRTRIDAEGGVHDRPESVERVEQAKFALVSGHAAIVSDTSCRWHLQQALPGLDIDVEGIHLQEFARAHPDADQWQAGFAGRTVAEGATKGALYGHRIEADPDLGDDLGQTPLNELGVEYLSDRGQVKAYLAESGYVAVYPDEEWTSDEHVEWFVDEVLPHVKGGDGE
jgi:hypothetical protein